MINQREIFNQESVSELISVCRELAGSGYAPASGSNASLRRPEGIWITAAGCLLKDLSQHDLVLVDEEGRVLAGTGRPSKEVHLHLAAYRANPGIGAVLHFHPPHAVAACSLLRSGKNVLPAMTATFVMRVHGLEALPFYPPGDETLAAEVGRVLAESQVALLRNHGLVSAGRTVVEAAWAVEETEANARIFLLSGGRGETIPWEDCQRLRERYWTKEGSGWSA